MHTTMPSQALLQELFFYDPVTGHLINKKPRAGVTRNSRAGSTDTHGYRQVKINGVLYLEHRLIWVMQYGKEPSCQLDHINRVRDDNRLENLRLAPNNEVDNAQNMGLRVNNTSGVRGVSWIRRLNKWQVQIQTGRKKQHVGMYECLLDAIAARLAAERRYFSYLTQ